MQDLITAEQRFIHLFGDGKIESFFSPGRVNLIGEHIDYNGGSVLPIAISLGISALVRRRADAMVNVHAETFSETSSFSLDTDFVFQKNATLHWSDYIKATLQVLKDNKVKMSGADILISSTLPVGSGLSSSASLECLIAFIFNENYYSKNRVALAKDAQLAERKYVEVNCGIMDQYIIANGKADNAILLHCDSLKQTFIPADFGDYQLVILNSNVPRSLATSKYNERRAECETAFTILKNIDIAENLCDVHEVSLAFLEDDILYQRAKHVILENKRVLYAAELLKSGDIEAFGQQLTESHISLDTDYEVSCFELNMLVHYSTHFEGCIGARMTGAGFGGCCIALVKKDRIKKFISYVGKKYKEKTQLEASFYLVDIVDSVRRIK